MPIPSFVSATAPVSLNNTKSINRPASIATDDVLYALVVANYSDATVTPPAGWTDVSALAFDESSIWSSERRVYRKVVGSGDGSSDSWKIDGQGGGNNFGAIAIVAYRDDAGVDVGDKDAPSGSAGSIVAPSITTTGANRKLLAFFDAGGDRTAVTASGMTSRAAGYVSADGADRTLAIFDEDFATAGATGTRTATLASATDVRYGALLAIIGSGSSGPPAAPTIGTTTAIGNTGATINWTDNSADETGFKVEWSPSPYSVWTAASNSPAAANATSLAITGLSPATTYKARVASTNANGDSAWVETATFTTTNTVKKLKLKIDASAAGATGISGVVWAAQVGAIAGAEIGEFTGQAFEVALEGGQAVLKVPVSAFGGGSLTVSDTPVALVRNATNTSGIVSCTVIEE